MSKVFAPDGLPWRVERHWMPRWGDESPLTRQRRGLRRLHGGTDVTFGGFDLASIGDLGGPFVVIGLVILVVALLALLGLVLLPLLLVVVDLVVVVLLGAVLVLGRVLFRRPWTIEAIPPAVQDEERWHDVPGWTAAREWKVVGWRASRELKADLRRRIEAGLPLPDADPTGGVIS